ncbi:organelle RRM domain-containing protein 2, mitochondrial isoform X2 [Salvia hispanica]|uniref:organelle RRM domain-containing protein 2, mitochondrial isoform X2 n=1 Tax=Salvia hispanica TaxID=49212 RepID=UPI00200905A5|nr:organelle RRM domain-containing protein 2, mitochondrial isoform X2 [Salvia hispanica]
MNDSALNITLVPVPYYHVYGSCVKNDYRFFKSHETGLSRTTTDDMLYKAFAPFGNLREAKVIIDRGSGKSRGFGFVTYDTVEEAEKARSGLNGQFIDGWVIFVDPAKPREAPQQPPPRRDMQSTDTGYTSNKTVGWSGY